MSQQDDYNDAVLELLKALVEREVDPNKQYMHPLFVLLEYANLQKPIRDSDCDFDR